MRRAGSSGSVVPLTSDGFTFTGVGEGSLTADPDLLLEPTRLYVDDVRRLSGRIDVLLHAAGLEISRNLPDKEPREYDLVFDVINVSWGGGRKIGSQGGDFPDVAISDDAYIGLP